MLQRVRRGEPSGAAALFEKYSAPLLRFTDRMLGSRADAEEITQEVFVKMITRVEQYDGQAPVSSWLFAIAANACRDRLRRGRRAAPVALDAIAERASPDEAADSALVEKERRAAVRAAPSSLSPEQREALLLPRDPRPPH